MNSVIKGDPVGQVPICGHIEAPDFSLELSMQCGQIFGSEKRGETYLVTIGTGAVSLRQEGASIAFVTDGNLDRSRIIGYLGLDDDLGRILRSITRDSFMRRVVSSARGLRLLKQDPWPCLCSYIISANNRVERIDSIVKQIAQASGVPHIVDGETVHSLPGPDVLAACAESGLRSCGAGFRAPYLLGAAAMVAGGTIDFDDVAGMPTEQARDVLKTIPGVGDKVADCVLLFAFSRYEVFPVDVWIRRAVQVRYFNSREVKPEEIRRFGGEYFGEYAGYAQEYIYYYARKHSLI